MVPTDAARPARVEHLVVPRSKPDRMRAHSPREATISAGRFAFHRQADQQARDCAGAARPSITSAIAAAASSVVRSSCRVSFQSVLQTWNQRSLSAIVNTSRSTQRPGETAEKKLSRGFAA